MFKLLSKESNIFSIPVYIAFLVVMLVTFNFFTLSSLNIFSLLLTLAGIALGYFTFSSIGLNLQNHLSLFLYSAFVFALYPGDLDIGLAMALLTNSFLLLVLSNTDEEFRRKSYVLVGSIVALNYIFLPATWPMALFVILHITATSARIGLHIFRFFFGIMLVAFSYFALMYAWGFTAWNDAYFPFKDFSWSRDISSLLYLSPVALLLFYSLFDHFAHYNKKSPDSKFKYTFVLVFGLAQLITIFLYMGYSYEFLLLMAIPATIVLSRMLRYSKKYWLKEMGLWLVLLCLIAFKIEIILK